jgi:hypothetical protein
VAFWTESTLEPLRKYRFRVNLGDGELWWAKTVTQPSPEVSMGEYQLVNHKIKYPGIVTWNDIDIVLVDVGEKGIELYKKLGDVGYNFASGGDGVEKEQYGGKLVVIEKINANGDIIEVWTLYNPFIKGIKNGDLDYSSDDLLDITLTLAYDSAHLGKESKTLTETKSAQVSTTGAETNGQ